MKIPLSKYVRHFTENRLLNKLAHFARQAGLKTVYSVLLLFYAFKRKDTPAWAKRIIFGVLGYFIAPIDAIPDLSPIIGYTDDVGMLSFGLVMIAAYINDEVKIKARKKLKEWFGEYDLQDLATVDKQL
ncbi:MAG: YkvA family protein [Bacteroidota bacterium]